MNYENRVVAFIDILGFQNIINKTLFENGSDNEDTINNLKNALLIARKSLGVGEKDDKKKYQVSQFSDSFVISRPVEEPSGVFYTLLDIRFLIVDLLANGILCRGGITHGKIIHNDELLFGPAMIEAYDIETKVANYPRIILDEKIFDIAAKYHAPHHNARLEIESIGELIRQDSDGMYYIDYFASIIGEFNDPEYDFYDYLVKLQVIVENGLLNKKLNIKVKYNWLQTRYNETVKYIQEIKFPGAGEPEAQEAYASLKQI